MTSPTSAQFVFILGTRPEAIKLAPVILEMKERDLFYTVVATGQHPQLCTSALAEFGIEPNIYMSALTPNQTLSQLTAEILRKLSEIVPKKRNLAIIVQGDTTSAFAGAYFGFMNQFKVIHIEAGLRTDEPKRPFPEEMNRRLISQLTDINFAVTERNKQALVDEGINEKYVHVVGNTVIDALNKFAITGNSKEHSAKVLVTLHRRENHGLNIFKATEILSKIGNHFKKEFEFIYIRHPNPNSWNSIAPEFLKLANLTVIPPQSYSEIVKLLHSTAIIVTDSGGFQEEATFLGIPTLIVREETERIEAVESGVCELVGVEGDLLENRLMWLLSNGKNLAERSKPSPIFGIGNSSKLIVDKLIEMNCVLSCHE